MDLISMTPDKRKLRIGGKGGDLLNNVVLIIFITTTTKLCYSIVNQSALPVYYLSRDYLVT